jgi:hypothetical protein
MKNTKRAFAAVALAGAALALTGTPHAAADTLVGGSLLNTLGTAGAADSGGRQFSVDGDSPASGATISGNSAVQSIGS